MQPTRRLCLLSLFMTSLSMAQEGAGRQPPLLDVSLLNPQRSPAKDPLSTPITRLQHWSRRCVNLVVKYQQNPLRACRTMAYVHVAMQAGWATHRADDPALSEAAAHTCAAGLLETLYPHETPGSLRAQARRLIRLALPGAVIGPAYNRAQAVIEALTERSLRDGAGRVWPPQRRPADFEGIWQPAPPLFAALPVEGLAGEWRCWHGSAAMGALVEAVAVAPRPGSVAYRADLQELLAVAGRLTAAQRQTASAWHLDAGSVTPPGIWLLMALPLWRLPSNPAASASPAPMLSALARLCTGMHDAMVACWAVKMRDWSERPVTGAHRAGHADFRPLLVTPGFPGYVSGHATVSATAAHLLGLDWPELRSHWQSLAEEAAVSRLWGGIHFRSDNDEGLSLGRAVAHRVASLAHPWLADMKLL